MNRFITLSLVAVLLTGAAGAYAPVAHAQLVAEPPGSEPLSDPSLNNPTIAEPSPAASPRGGGISMPNLDQLPSQGVFSTVMIWIMSLFAWLLGIAVITLDYSVYYTVATMGTYLDKLAVIGVVWETMRDLANIILIFGFLAAGIAVILNLDEGVYGWSSKMIPKLLIGAVLINFSLFFSQAVIDVGNLFATQFYTQINGGTGAGQKFANGGTISNEGISNAIMTSLGMATLYQAAQKPKGLDQVFANVANTVFVGFLGSILFIISAFVMFSLAFILIARFVTLIFVIITSPVGMASFVIPQLGGFGKQWWDYLIQQTITAPVLLLLLYVALRIITAPAFLTGFTGGTEADWVGFLQTSNGGVFAGFAGLLLSFLVAMGLLLAVVMASKKLGAFGAGWATGMGGKLSFGVAGMVGRSTIGWGAHRAGQALRRTAFARVPVVGTSAVRALEGIGKQSFDARGRLKSLPYVGVDVGAPQKGGYAADLKARTDRRVKYAEDLKGRDLEDNEKAERAVLLNDIKKLQKQQKEAPTVGEFNRLEGQIKDKQKRVEEIETVTDAGAQRKYASALNLWTDPKNRFNSTFNFASNTDAARKIRDAAKKGKQDKDLAATFKRAIEENAEEGGVAATPGAAAGTTGGTPGGTTPPAGGGAPAGGTTPPAEGGGGPTT